MRVFSLRWSLPAGLTVALAASAAFADEPPALPQLPPNVAVSPDGSVAVERTPEQGVDVHVQTAAGTVHAYGCDRVELDASTAGAPCPHALPYPPSAYPPPVYRRPPVTAYPQRWRRAPRWTPDPGRTGALVGASLVFGLGTAGAGGAYVASLHRDEGVDCALVGGCRRGPSLPALYSMGAFMTLTPSIPRYVVGDVGMGLLFTGLRGGSFALGAAIDWQDESHVLPVTLAFVLPATLGIIDLATTPHREEMRRAPSDDAAAFDLSIDGVGPTATLDARGGLAPSLGALGRF